MLLEIFGGFIIKENWMDLIKKKLKNLVELHSKIIRNPTEKA